MTSVIVHPKVPTDLLDKSKEMTREITCKLPVKRGHCRALFPRWRYDSETKKCYEFGFGGCDGNGNNFLSEKDCMKYCEGV
ncbi:PI-actitoxin-Aeq3c-like [Chrysoperla carnea]|uniref:PI-actitoxin-Aeq3c-like n=1 Tax=Chrysoperla carnea TaxID=189513 RepID=UPI001D07B112|nr:PI-actitoxin-Aeq3c-like [Chrysoperla carnea]